MNSDTLRLSLLPLPTKPGDKNANLNRVADALATLPKGTDVVLLPELFTTALPDNVEQAAALAERNTGQTIDTLRMWSDRYSCAFAGTFLASTHPHIYNRAFFIEPGSDETLYDKAHLFILGKETHILHPGTEQPRTVRFRRWNIAVAVCFDLRFPAWIRNNPTSPYDLLLIPSSWPASRQYAFTHLAIARAIENQAVVATCNTGGADFAPSAILDAAGQPVDATHTGPWITIDLHLDQLTEYRRKYPFLRCSDKISVQPQQKFGD